MLHKPITFFQVLALYTAHSVLNPIIASYVYGWMSN